MVNPTLNLLNTTWSCFVDKVLMFWEVNNIVIVIIDKRGKGHFTASRSCKQLVRLN